MSILPEQHDVEIPVAQFSFELVQKMATGATDGLILLSGEGGEPGRYLSAAVFLETLMKQAVPKSETQRAAAVAGTGLGISIAANWLLLATPLGPLAMASWMGTLVAPAHTNPRACTILILNLTKGAIKLKTKYLVCGVQTGHPAYSDGSTKFPSPDDLDVIRGLEETESETQASIGAYQFQKSLQLGAGFQGTAGALSFELSDPKAHGKQLGIAWNIPEGVLPDAIMHSVPGLGTTVPGLGITADLFGNYADLPAFYSATADVSSKEIRRGDHTGAIHVDACYGPRSYNKDKIEYDRGSWNDVVLTVLVQ